MSICGHPEAPARRRSSSRCRRTDGGSRLVKKLERPEAQRPSRVSIAVPEMVRYDFADGLRCRRQVWVGQGAFMDWARILAYVTGTVAQELLARNEYLAAENRIMKA